MRKIALSLVLVLGCLTARAQYDVSFSHYWTLEPSFNPGAVGKEAKLNVTGAYAMDLVGFEHNPRTMFISGDMPFYLGRTLTGAGLQVMNDQLGLFTHQRLAGQFACKKSLLGGTLSIGVQAGLINEQFDGSRLDLEDASDPAFSGSEINGNAIDLAAGVYYIRGPWYVGVSAQHLTAPLVELGETNELQVDRTYYLTGGYNIRLKNPFLSIHPSVLLRTDGVGYRGDVTARLAYTNDKKLMYCGVGCSPTNSVTALIGGSFHGIIIGYSYEMYTGAISVGNGSHELFVAYQMDVNLVKHGKNRHKSVRHL